MMVIALIIGSWSALAVVAVALCQMASRGDRQMQIAARTPDAPAARTPDAPAARPTPQGRGARHAFRYRGRDAQLSRPHELPPRSH